MIKKLTRQGNSAALIIDRAIMDLMGIDMQTPLKLTLNGRQLTVEAMSDEERKAKFQAAMEETGRTYAEAFKKLAE